MPVHLVGKNKIERKTCLANLVCERLRVCGHEAEVQLNRPATDGHIDRVVVNSSLGVIHITAMASTKPNDMIPWVGDEDLRLEDKNFAAFGWNTKDDRTMIFFVASENFPNTPQLTKDTVRQASDRALSTVLT